MLGSAALADSVQLLLDGSLHAKDSRHGSIVSHSFLHTVIPTVHWSLSHDTGQSKLRISAAESTAESSDRYFNNIV